MTLRTRIALIASTAVMVTVLLIAAVVFATARARVYHDIDRSLLERMEGGRAAFGVLLDDLGRRRDSPLRPSSGFDVLYVQITYPDGRVVRPADQDIVLPLPTRGSVRRRPVYESVLVEGEPLRVVTASGPDGSMLQLARSLSELNSSSRSLVLSLLVASALGMTAAAGLGLVVARSSLRPVASLTNAAEAVADTGSLTTRIAVSRQDEVGRLAAAFNKMMDALERSRNQQQRLVRDAGHELRTPLTALRTNIEFLAKADSLPPGQRAAIYDDLTGELEELTDLVNEVVTLAADPDATEKAVRLDLFEVAAGVVARYQRRAADNEIVLSGSGGETIGRPVALDRAMNNLVDNAIKWSQPGGAVRVDVDGTRVVVSDAGPGIPPEERERVFDRFYRSDSARAMSGSGLGLSIARRIVEEHGGRIWVEESESGGARFGLEVPGIDQSVFLEIS